MPPDFGMIAALQGDLDTSDGVGKVFFRQDTGPDVLRRAAEHINRAFPEDDEVNPTHAVLITWADVATHERQSRGDSVVQKVSITWLFKSSGVKQIVYSLVNLLLYRETPSSWLLHPWRRPHLLLSCTPGMESGSPPRLYITVASSFMLDSIRVWSGISSLRQMDHTTALQLMTRHLSGL